MSQNNYDNMPIINITKDEWRIGFAAGERLITITPFALHIDGRDGRRQEVPWGELVDLLDELDGVYAADDFVIPANPTLLIPILGEILADDDLGNRVEWFPVEETLL